MTQQTEGKHTHWRVQLGQKLFVSELRFLTPICLLAAHIPNTQHQLHSSSSDTVNHSVLSAGFKARLPNIRPAAHIRPASI